MSLKVYTLTLSGMLLLYMLRSGYSFSKPYLKAQYRMTSFFLSLVDAAQFIGLGIAFTIKYLLDQNYTVSNLRNHAMVMSFCYLLIPIIPLVANVPATHFQFLLLLSFFGFGFLQFAFQPTLSREMKKYYTKEEHEGMFTCWDSGKHLGRILGFAFMQTTVIGLAITWQASLLVLFTLMVVYIGLIHYELDINQVQNMRLSNVRHSIPDVDPDTVGITWSQFAQFGKRCMLTPSTRYYILLSCCFRGMSFNFTYWLSTYLFSYSYPQLSGKMSLVFVVPIYCGNFLIGKMHEDAISNEQSLTNSNIFLIICSLISFAGLNYLCTPTPQMNYIQFVMIIMVEGFVIGGFYNILKSNRNLCGKFNNRQKDMLDTFINAIVNFSAALVTLAIGITLTGKALAGSVHPEAGIFQVLRVVSVVAIVLLILWILAIYQKIDQDKRQSQEMGDELQLE